MESDPDSLLSRGYRAGLFDGEGCIAFRKNHMPVIQMEMTQEEPIRDFATAYGGSIVRRKRAGKQGSWCWYASGKNLVHALSDIGPLLKAKKPDFQIVLPAVKVLLDHPPRCAYTPQERKALCRAAQKMKRLRARRKENGRQ